MILHSHLYVGGNENKLQTKSLNQRLEIGFSFVNKLSLELNIVNNFHFYQMSNWNPWTMNYETKIIFNEYAWETLKSLINEKLFFKD